MKLLIALVATATLAACATTSAPAFSTQVTEAYALVQTLAVEADILAASGVITKDEAAKIAQSASAAKASLDVANAIHATNAADGGNQITTAIAALNQLNAELLALQAAKQ